MSDFEPPGDTSSTPSETLTPAPGVPPPPASAWPAVSPPPPPPPGAVHRRRGLPTIAIVAIGFVALLGALAIVGVLVGDDATKDSDTTSVFELSAGTCFDDPPELTGSEIVQVDELATTPCDTAHDNEVFHVYDLPDGEYPGADTAFERGFDGCIEGFKDFVGTDWEDSTLDMDVLFVPTDETWKIGDREVVCALFASDFTALTGSMRGTRR